MQDLSYRSALAVAALPTPSASLKGVTVRLTTDDKPYWCNGTTWVDLTAAGSASPAGNDREIQYNNAGSTAGAANVEVHGNDLLIGVSNAPTTPPPDYVKLFGKRFGPAGSRVIPAAVGPSGVDYALMPSMWRQKIGIWSPPGNSNTVPGVFGTAAWTTVGTATTRNVAVLNLFTRMRRLGYVSAATAGSLASIRTAQAQYSVGNGAGLGGFFMSFRFAITDAAAVAGARFFAGIKGGTSAPTNVEPSTIPSCIGVAQLSTNATQLYIVYGGAVAQTPIPLGANFPPMNGTGANNGIAYDFTVWCPPNELNVMNWSLERIGTSFTASGRIEDPAGMTTPSEGSLMMPCMWRCNNTTAAAVAFDLINFYIETDY